MYSYDYSSHLWRYKKWEKNYILKSSRIISIHYHLIQNYKSF